MSEKLMANCKHQRKPHTVWYWVEDGRPEYGPMSATFDNLKDALAFAQSGIDQGNPILRWVKVFRADNESYTCARWDNPVPYDPPKPEPIVIPSKSKHAYPDGSFLRPWGCADCHPAWYLGSAFLVGAVLTAVFAFVGWGLIG